MARIMELRCLATLATLGLALAITGCAKEPECLIADSLVKIESEVLDKHQLQLFLRTSGFQDKVQFYEIYKTTPHFDSCGQSDTEIISQVFIDLELGNPNILAINNKKLSLVYTDDPNSATQIRVNIQ